MNRRLVCEMPVGDSSPGGLTDVDTPSWAARLSWSVGDGCALRDADGIRHSRVGRWAVFDEQFSLVGVESMVNMELTGETHDVRGSHIFWSVDLSPRVIRVELLEPITVIGE